MYAHTGHCHAHMYICLLQKLAEDLQTETDSLESLKFVLGVIAKVREMSLEVELRYRDVQERYRTLAMYSIEVRVMLCMFSTNVDAYV